MKANAGEPCNSAVALNKCFDIWALPSQSTNGLSLEADTTTIWAQTSFTASESGCPPQADLAPFPVGEIFF